MDDPKSRSAVQQRITPIAVWWPAIQTHVQVYVLEGEFLGLIDTAARDASLADALASVGRAPADFSLVLNTHAHRDHVGGNATIKTAGGAQICVHREDAPFVEDPGRCFDQFFAEKGRLLRGDEATAAERALYLEELGHGLPVDRHLEHGDRLDLGGSFELKVVHLPGHTPGSAGFLWEKEGILVAGDSVLGLGSAEGNLPLIFDLDAYHRSVDLLLELPIKTLHTTHPYRARRVPPATVREGTEVRTFLEDSLEMATRLLDAFVAAEHGIAPEAPIEEITNAVIAALPTELGFKALTELPFPDFSLNTVIWGTRSWRRPS